MIVAQTMTVLTATGNNLTIKGDLTRRSVVSRLDPKVAQPELRDFAYDPIADAKENRGELVAAVLTVLRAYHVAGRPKRPTPPLQSFVKWSDTVRGPLMWFGQGDPVGTMARLREADPTIINLKAVLTAWRDEFGADPTTAKDAVNAADATVATREEGRSTATCGPIPIPPFAPRSCWSPVAATQLTPAYSANGSANTSTASSTSKPVTFSPSKCRGCCTEIAAGR
jgi:hypothetical protein